MRATGPQRKEDQEQNVVQSAPEDRDGAVSPPCEQDCWPLQARRLPCLHQRAAVARLRRLGRRADRQKRRSGGRAQRLRRPAMSEQLMPCNRRGAVAAHGHGIRNQAAPGHGCPLSRLLPSNVERYRYRDSLGGIHERVLGLIVLDKLGVRTLAVSIVVSTAREPTENTARAYEARRPLPSPVLASDLGGSEASPRNSR